MTMNTNTNKMQERTPEVSFRIAADGGGKTVILNLYVDGHYAGECTAYREAGNRNRLHVYPRRILFPYSRMKLDLRRAVWYFNIPPEKPAG